MDTIEELGGTYFYAGRTNLSASEMLFMVFCEETAHQLGIEDLGAIVAVVSGLNVSKTRGKFRGNIKDTSYASRGARKIFGKNVHGNVKLPSVVGGYPHPLCGSSLRERWEHLSDAQCPSLVG